MISQEFSSETHSMGIVLGKISVETPNYTVIKKTGDYEIRKYSPSVLAEVRAADLYCSEGERNGESIDRDGFRLLARYIGVFGSPANSSVLNSEAEGISMTAPVTSSPESISMTAPVISQETGVEANQEPSAQGSMAFHLPNKYTGVDQAPKPKDPRVRLKQIPTRSVAVMGFSGSTDLRRCRPKAKQFFELLKSDGVSMIGNPDRLEVAHWNLARYNPPWTLPWKKLNEIHIELENVDQQVTSSVA